MKIQKHKSPNNKVESYSLWLSANDTYNWAHRINNSWPCSQLSNNRFFVYVDSNGLCDFTLNGRDGDCDATELSACVADHITEDCKHLWPCWN